MTTYQTALIDCIGTSNLDKAREIAEKHCVLDAESKSMVFIDLENPYVLNELFATEIISKEEQKELLDSDAIQLVLVA